MFSFTMNYLTMNYKKSEEKNIYKKFPLSIILLNCTFKSIPLLFIGNINKKNHLNIYTLALKYSLLHLCYICYNNQNYWKF